MWILKIKTCKISALFNPVLKWKYHLEIVLIFYFYVFCC